MLSAIATRATPRPTCDAVVCTCPTPRPLKQGECNGEFARYLPGECVQCRRPYFGERR